jgi:hypothetical protein
MKEADHSTMSTIKSPPAKKRLSLERDCRNLYGENSKSSRKNIRRHKQRSHMQERRVVHDALSTIKGIPAEDMVIAAELMARIRTTVSHRLGFKKEPDLPLKYVLDRRASPSWTILPDKLKFSSMIQNLYRSIHRKPDA